MEPFPQRSWRSFAPFPLFVRRGNPRLFGIIILLKALYLPGCCQFKPAPFLLLKEPDYSLFPAPFRPTEPVTAGRSLLLSFACRQRHIYVAFLLGRAKRCAQRGALFLEALPRGAGSIQHSLSWEDAKLPEAAASTKQQRCFSDGS